MLLTCPKCQTVYDAPAERVRRAKKVRCASCGTVWMPDLGVQAPSSAAQEWDVRQSRVGANAQDEYVPETKADPNWQAFGGEGKSANPDWQAFSNASGEGNSPDWQAFSNGGDRSAEWEPQEREVKQAQEAAFSDVRDSSYAPAGDEREGEPFEEKKENFSFYDDGEEPPTFDFNSPSEETELPEDFKIPEFKEPFTPVDYPDKTFWQEWSKPLFFLSLLCIAGAVWLTFFHKVKTIPMAFKTVTYEFIEKDYKKFLIINASLENQSPDYAYPRRFKVVFYSSNGRLLADRAAPSPLGALPPGETGSFELRFERPPAQAAKAELVLDAVDFSEQADLPVEHPEPEAIGRIKKMQPVPLKDGTENRSPEEGMPVRVLPQSDVPQTQESAEAQTSVSGGETVIPATAPSNTAP